MKTITIHVEDSKYGFVINLLKRLNFVKIDDEDKNESFTDAQKQLLDQRLDELLQGKVEIIGWEAVRDILK